MKKFIFQIGFSFMLITMGIMMSFFELADFETVNGANAVYQTDVLKTDVTKADPLYVEINDEDVQIHYEYDDSLKDQVEIEVSEALDYSLKTNTLRIDDDKFHLFSGKKYIDTFIDGLKENKLYYFHFSKPRDRYRVIIRCKESNLSNIILYD